MAADVDKLVAMLRADAWCEEIDDALLMPTWTLERLRFLLHRVKRHTAGGPSGLSYLLLLHAPVAFQQAFMTFCRRARS